MQQDTKNLLGIAMKLVVTENAAGLEIDFAEAAQAMTLTQVVRPDIDRVDGQSASGNVSERWILSAGTGAETSARSLAHRDTTRSRPLELLLHSATAGPQKGEWPLPL